MESPELSLENLATSYSDSAIHRIGSGDTIESPFGSNLATPNDDIYGAPGIVERLAAANELNTYFLPGDNAEVTKSPNPAKEIEPKAVEEIQSFTEDVELVSQRNSPLSSLGSEKSIFSPDCSSPETHWLGLQHTSTLYSLPNSHIVVEKKPDSVDQAEGSVENPERPDSQRSALKMDPAMIKSLSANCARIVFFLPWCITVGAVLLLCPSNLEFVAVSLGYVEAMDHIHRFSYWAEYGFPHVVSFLAFLGLQAWLFPSVGTIIIGGALGQFVYAWHSFLPDYSVPLGSDDFQMVYHLATSFWLTDSPFGIRKVGDRFYADSTGGRLPLLVLDAEPDGEENTEKPTQ